MKKRTSASSYDNDDWGSSNDDWGNASDDWGSGSKNTGKRNNDWKSSKDDWNSNSDDWGIHDDWGDSNNGRNKGHQGWGIKNNTDSSQGWSGFSERSKSQGTFEDSGMSFSDSDYGMKKRRRISMPSLPVGAILKIGIIGIIIAAIAGVVFFLISNSASIAQGIRIITERILYSAVIALLFWGILNAFLKRVLPVKLQGILFLVIFIISFICQFVPEIGSTLAVLIFTVFGIVILLYLMVK